MYSLKVKAALNLKKDVLCAILNTSSISSRYTVLRLTHAILSIIPAIFHIQETVFLIYARHYYETGSIHTMGVSREPFFSTICSYSYLFYSCYLTLHVVKTMCIYCEFWSFSLNCSAGVCSHWPRSLSWSNVAVFSDGGEMISTTWVFAQYYLRTYRCTTVKTMSMMI